MPVNDRGRRLISDADDSAISRYQNGSELDYIVRQLSAKFPDIVRLRPETEQVFEYEDVRNAYEATIIELVSENTETDTYRVLRQDKRLGLARTYNKAVKYETGDQIVLLRPQEKEDENDWYIQGFRRYRSKEIYSINVDDIDADGKLEYLSFDSDQTSIPVADVDRFLLQSDKIEVEKGGLVSLNLRFKVTNFKPSGIAMFISPSTGIAKRSTDQIINALVSSEDCEMVYIDNNDRIQSMNTFRLIKNPWKGDVEPNKLIKASLNNGSWIVLAEECEEDG